MKGTFTLLLALTLSVAVNAQTKIQKLDASAGSLEKNPGLSILTPGAKQSNAPKRKIEVDEGEHIMGYYDTDDLPTLYDDGYFTTGFTGSNPVANLFEGDVLSKFNGGQLLRMRFAVACDVYVSNAFIYLEDAQGYIRTEALAKVNIEQTISAGWYDVELPNPITIDSSCGYLIGFEVTETGYNYPLVTDYELDVDYTSDYGFLIYMTYYGTTSWWYLGDDYGSLCIQAVVKGGNFPDDDITLKKLSAQKFAPKGDDLSYSFNIRNSGDKIPTSYEMKVTLDGSEVETLSDPIALTGNYQTIEKSLSTDNLDYGSHTLRVEVVSINGVTPTEYTSDDVLETSFVIYNEDETVERQKHVIEHFTSIYCGYCPLGIETLQALVDRNPDKYAWVSLHGYAMGADPYCLFPGYYYDIEYFSGASSLGYPAAAFSRALLTSDYLGLKKEMACGIGYYSQYQSMVAQSIDEAVDAAYEGVPAFVSVDITPEYNSDTRQLTITVSGEGGDLAKTLLNGNLLTVYLTENGIEGTQEDYTNGSYRDGYFVDFTHDHVLRAILHENDWGEDINWTSDSSYKNTVTTTLDSSWDDSRIYITALISGPMVVLQDGEYYFGSVDDAMVNNANQVKLTDVPEGISAVTVNTNDVTRTYYTTDGRQLSAPAKGVNIVKCSDGSVKKIYVK